MSAAAEPRREEVRIVRRLGSPFHRLDSTWLVVRVCLPRPPVMSLAVSRSPVSLLSASDTFNWFVFYKRVARRDTVYHFSTWETCTTCDCCLKKLRRPTATNAFSRVTLPLLVPRNGKRDIRSPVIRAHTKVVYKRGCLCKQRGTCVRFARLCEPTMPAGPDSTKVITRLSITRLASEPARIIANASQVADVAIGTICSEHIWCTERGCRAPRPPATRDGEAYQ